MGIDSASNIVSIRPPSTHIIPPFATSTRIEEMPEPIVPRFGRRLDDDLMMRPRRPVWFRDRLAHDEGVRAVGEIDDATAVNDDLIDMPYICHVAKNAPSRFPIASLFAAHPDA